MFTFNNSFMIPVNYSFAFFGLFFASIFDLKTREIPDWLNYSLIAVGFSSALISSVKYSDYGFLLRSLAGFLLFFAIAMLLYKTGQWGGGDAKTLMALGALIGLDFNKGVPILLLLIFNIFIVGAVYGFFWSGFLVFKNWIKFKKAFRTILLSKNVIRIRKIVIVAVLFFLAISFFIPFPFKVLMFTFAAMIFFLFYFFIYSKAIETSAMIKSVSVNKLTPGDWIVDEIVIKGKKVCDSKEGVSKEQIAELLKLKKAHKISKIRIKEGIPFMPSFFIAFIITLLFNNWLVLFV